jgi:hypothetical protein
LGKGNWLKEFNLDIDDAAIFGDDPIAVAVEVFWVGGLNLGETATVPKLLDVTVVITKAANYQLHGRVSRSNALQG